MRMMLYFLPKVEIVCAPPSGCRFRIFVLNNRPTAKFSLMKGPTVLHGLTESSLYPLSKNDTKRAWWSQIGTNFINYPGTVTHR